ncbi:hypothetical protein K227x_59760 [Rubripirellula lacrimiformis]|uniref:DUF3500 domain-containing protein n=1 Tax=Rubripirellula lacrimiformis TaxID=1930273 RepID=A0A517NK76_9BACT|nr:DUF3500 domain-containing protein [Rubripirellula lacrimiformis]QDT07548.1 hypothetical protein K227x_59760 [Rubripirellula lacrimiformis]
MSQFEPIKKSLIKPGSINRRTFLENSAATIAAGSLIGGGLTNMPLRAEPVASASAESLVGQLFQTMDAKQKKAVCFDWDHVDKKRGLLRTFVANNWNITDQEINGDFYSDQQRDLIEQAFKAIIHPDWHERYYQQLEDDAGGFGNEQSIAIFGNPTEDGEKFELVITGRHMTVRCDGNSADHVAFGGPVFYGHAPEGEEGPNHTDNVFWNQAVAANDLYKMLDGRQQKQALVPTTPREQAVAFRGHSSDITGLPVSDMASDQREHLQGVLATMVEMYRTPDQQEAMQCLKTQGGLDACKLSFYQDHDIGKDGVWDNWRLEGPSFVWHYRGAPHVHVWVNIADSADVKLNA